jgi:hypothetical protein
VVQGLNQPGFGEIKVATKLACCWNVTNRGSTVRCHMYYESNYESPASEEPEQENWSMKPQETHEEPK